MGYAQSMVIGYDQELHVYIYIYNHDADGHSSLRSSYLIL